MQPARPLPRRRARQP